jgi:ParB family chromosome partitioning protein
MKKNSPRRQIVDAIDFMTSDSNEQQIVEIEIDKVHEFFEHPFHLYEGKRLEDMIESIKNNGVLNPVIVRRISEDEFEMLSGHNRMNASKLAGLNTIPAFIKEHLTDEEAYIYVIETNMMQRSFNDMYPSEKAIVLEMRYEKVSNQGKRNDILRELNSLEKGEVEENEIISDSRGRIAKEYGLSGRSMARLLRLNKLIDEWKLEVDNEYIALLTGVELSYLPEIIQSHIYYECKDMVIKLSLNDSKILKKMNDDKLLDQNTVSKFLLKNEKSKVKNNIYQNIKLNKAVYNKYFAENSNKKEVEETIEKALKSYFESVGRNIS